MSRPSKIVGVVLVAGVLALGILGGRVDLWSSSGRPAQPGVASAQAVGEAEGLQSAFIRIAQTVGPAVVSISTEQVERVRQYFRGHPFFGGPGGDQFEEFFRQFYGDIPEREQRRFGLGSGVIIDERGLILTNEHVVADAEKITVTLADGREFSGTVKGKDPRSDLAVITIDAKKLTAAKLGDSSTVQTGQWAIALGNPFGLVATGASARAFGAEPTLTVGVISALNRQLPRISRYDRDYADLIQTDAAINPGNSGGPLINLQGEVIGINVAILTSSRGFEGVGFAIPINKAKSILDTLIEGKQVIYGWLGIQIQDITDDVAEYYGLQEREGVLVYQVLPDSPASNAGLKDGDIIKTFDGQAIRHSRELIERVSGTKAGRKAPVEILRDGKRQTIQVEIGERPVDDGEGGPAASDAWRGLQVAGVDAETAGQFNLPPGITGVIVLDVEQGSPADEAGVRPGDVINEINRQKVESLNDYRKATAQVKSNKALVRTNRGYVVIKPGD
jgi:serine protease Do